MHEQYVRANNFNLKPGKTYFLLLPEDGVAHSAIATESPPEGGVVKISILGRNNQNYVRARGEMAFPRWYSPQEWGKWEIAETSCPMFDTLLPDRVEKLDNNVRAVRFVNDWGYIIFPNFTIPAPPIHKMTFTAQVVRWTTTLEGWGVDLEGNALGYRVEETLPFLTLRGLEMLREDLRTGKWEAVHSTSCMEVIWNTHKTP